MKIFKAHYIIDCPNCDYSFSVTRKELQKNSLISFKCEKCGQTFTISSATPVGSKLSDIFDVYYEEIEYNR